jgi:hypothetical protein
LDGWLLIKSMSGTGMSLATMNGGGAMTDTGTADAVIRIARENNVDVLMVDPFVKISDAPENDNKATDFVCRLARISHRRGHKVGILGDLCLLMAGLRR